MSSNFGPEFDALAERTFRRFDVGSVTARLPTESFEGNRELQVGDRVARLLEVGPAHTAGDAIVHVPDAGVVFTATSCSSRAPRSCGKGRSRTGSARATGSSSSTRA